MTKRVFKDTHFQRWKKRVEGNGNIFKKIEVLAEIYRDNINLIGAFLDCQLLTPEGHHIPRCVMICDNSVVIVPVLFCKENDEIYTIMVEQRRIIDGGFAIEFPSGGVGRTRDPKSMACQEIREELQINILPEELIPLAEDSIKVNPSFSGDVVDFFYFKKNVSISFLNEINGRSTGCHEDSEYIKVRVYKMEDVSNHLTSSAIIGIKLLERALNQNF